MCADPIFFLHFPRTAGTTVDEIFFSNLEHKNVIKIYSEDEYNRYKFIDSDQLSDIHYITGHLLLENLNPTRFYGHKVRAFTILRDPIKRLYSEYIFLKTWKDQHLYKLLNNNSISFSQYISSQEKLLFYRGKNFMTRCLSGDSIEESKDISASLQKAKDNLLNSFWFFGIQERFMESILLLSEKAGLKNILHQKHNKLQYKNDHSGLKPEELQVAIDYNQLDIELYNFALSAFEDRIKARGEDFQKKLSNFKFFNSKYQKLAGLVSANPVSDGNVGAEIYLPKNTDW